MRAISADGELRTTARDATRSAPLLLMLLMGACASGSRTSPSSNEPVTPAALDAEGPSGGEQDGGGDPSAAPAVRFIDAPAKIDDGLCQTLLLAVAQGSVHALGQALDATDVLVVEHALPVEVTGAGLVLEARRPHDECQVTARPAPEVTVVRGTSTPNLEWANGSMYARLDVPTSLSRRLFLGRVGGTAAVAEHAHAGSWEILAATEASGNFVLDGREVRLGPKQIVIVPPGVKHAWRPDPGSKLAAILIYSPPGPERRFIDLATTAKRRLLP